MGPRSTTSTPRRQRRARAGLAAVATCLLMATGCSSDGDDDSGADDAEPTSTTAAGGFAESGPPGDPAQTIDRAAVDDAVDAFGPLVVEAMEETGVPGVAYAVVFEDEVVAAEGVGVRELGGDDPVDADTVFQLASLSKPVGATVVASLVGDEVVAWDQPISEVDPDFALADPWVTDNVTFADLYSHRSGLPSHAGDILEDLGYDRATVLDRLRDFPLSPFRSTYAYTNFGLTEAAVAAASADGTSWEEASQERIYGPLGMERTSSTFEDYMAQENRAVPHVRDADGEWIVTPDQRDPDAQSPAGGVSSTATDMARWLLLQVGAGTVDGTEVVAEDALIATRTPHVTSSGPRSPSAHSGFYGLGTGVGYDDDGRTKLSHSGAFALGAGTSFAVLPGEQLGVVVLTNGQPVGLDQALVEIFLDLASTGEVSRDWVPLFGQFVEASIYPEAEVDYTQPVDDPEPAADAEAYTGTYASSIYGTLEISESDDDTLVLSVGPEPSEFELTHYDGDTFWFQPIGENGLLPSSVRFEVAPSGRATSVTVSWLEGESPGEGIGTFARG